MISKFLKASYRSKYVQDKSNIMTDCETKFFQLSTDIEVSKTKQDWDKIQALIDERYALFRNCINNLAFLDKKFMNRIKEK